MNIQATSVVLHFVNYLTKRSLVTANVCVSGEIKKLYSTTTVCRGLLTSLVFY